MTLFWPAIAGLILSFVLVGLLRPLPPVPWRWAWPGLLLHVGLWLVVHGMLTVCLGRPWFAMTAALAFLMLLVQVSNAKFHSLRQAFVFQDFEYFTDAILHPRLYIPFLGWWKFILIAVAVILALDVGLWLESAPLDRFSLAGQLGEAGLQMGLGASLLLLARKGAPVSFCPEEDMLILGFIGCLWCYAKAEKETLHLPSQLQTIAGSMETLPDLVVVQSESFFDPRPLFKGIRPEVLAEFDRLCNEALCHGSLGVPAWGANTVRSEFAFLSGASEAMLGVHRFNPYRKILRADLVTIVSVLKAAGYYTVCIHPYPASFYTRHKVYPHLGFDEFIDLAGFSDDQRFGPYISDLAVAEKAEAILSSCAKPVFLFIITMENHGPLHLEKPRLEDSQEFYSNNPPPDCEDLTVYLRHLRNADRMIGKMTNFLRQFPRSSLFCWYGDHVPIMSRVYDRLGFPSGDTAYLLWSNQQSETEGRQALPLHALAARLLRQINALAGQSHEC